MLKANTDRKLSYLLNDLKNFNEMFRKDVKSHEKPGFHSLFRRYVFGSLPPRLLKVKFIMKNPVDGACIWSPI